MQNSNGVTGRAKIIDTSVMFENPYRVLQHRDNQFLLLQRQLRLIRRRKVGDRAQKRALRREQRNSHTKREKQSMSDVE